MSDWPINCRECGPVVTNPAQHRYWHETRFAGDPLKGPQFQKPTNEGLATPKAERPPRRNKRQDVRALDAARALAKDGAGQDEACDRCRSPIKMQPNRDGDLTCPLCGNVRYTIPPDVAEEVTKSIRSHAPRLPGERKRPANRGSG